MYRRDFLDLTAGVLAAGAMAGGISGGALVGSTLFDRLSDGPIDAATYRAGRKLIATPFGRIACFERGRGDVALFLHGFPLNSFQWRGAIERLARYRRCLAPDFLGLGYSEPDPGQSVTPEAQVAMLGALLDTLGIHRVDIIANDSGGAVAQLFMLRFPGRVRTVLLTNCDVEPDSPPPALMPVIELARQGVFAEQWISPWLADKVLARSAQGIGGMTYTAPGHPTDEAIEYYFTPLVATPEGRARLHAYALGLDPNPLAGIEQELRRSAIPVRILWGTADDIFSAESPHYLHRLLPQSRGVRLIAGAKLFWPEERPDTIAEEARHLWGV
jgi:pimeloyl-ACP methyl ester carboxylesterase